MTRTVVDRSRNITKRKQNRSKYQKFVRKAIRRKPCSYMLITNIIILVLIVLSIFLSIVVIYAQKQAIVGYLREEELLTSKKKVVTFQQCEYEEMSPWYTDLCNNNADKNNFLWRERRLKSGNLDRRCSDQLETISCYNNVQTYTRPNITECSGVHPQPFKQFDSQIIVSFRAALLICCYFSAPAADVEKLKTNKKDKFRASDLVIYCPVCRLAPDMAFQSSDSNESCYHRLVTTKFGWPDVYQFCDPFSLIKDDDSVNCTEFKATFSFDAFNDIDKE